MAPGPLKERQMDSDRLSETTRGSPAPRTRRTGHAIAHRRNRLPTEQEPELPRLRVHQAWQGPNWNRAWRFRELLARSSRNAAYRGISAPFSVLSDSYA